MLRKALTVFQRAAQKAKDTGKPFAVVEMDKDDGRRVYVVPLDYTTGDEFEAFCGSIIWTTQD